MSSPALEKQRSKILEMVQEYYNLSKDLAQTDGQIRVSGKVYNANELINLVDASLDFWLTAGRYTKDFERRFAELLDVKWVGVVNSGSSANLLAISALTSHLLGENRLKPRDEVITVAAGFPTTINPIMQVGATPVFVDVDLPHYNVNISQLEHAISSKTKAIILAHTLGNPFNISEVSRIAKENNLWLIEDACDALGSTYQGQMVGTFGDIATFSFYPAHHITMGEGGAVATNNPKLQKILTSQRDWGRDCWCETGHDNSCHQRFNWKFKSLPKGYDHKYVYSHRGYNFKATDMQAAIGLAQLDKLPAFIEKRKQNYLMLHQKLQHLSDWLILPEATVDSDPSWFGFPVTVKESSRLNRTELTTYLDQAGIHTRLLFGGNLTKQPYMEHENFRVSGSLTITDQIMHNTFWLGVYPALGEPEISSIAETIERFINQNQDG